MHSITHIAEVTVEGYTQDIVARHATTGPRYRKAILVLGLLFLLGLAGFIARAAGDGFDERQPWGYLAATVAFLLTTAGAAPLIAIALRMVKAHWRRPLARVSELYATVGILTFIMFIPLLFLVPSATNRNSLWFQNESLGTLGKIPGAPHVYVTLALAFLVLCGLALLWVSSRPDRAVVLARRGNPSTEDTQSHTSWIGTRKQWQVLHLGLASLGGFFFLLLIGVISLFSIDFGMALVPGWRDAIFPAFQAVTALHAGLATVVLTLFLLRKYGSMERYIHMEHFWGASKILLGITLLWFYFWWSGFIIFWYGRMPVEQNLLQLLMFGPYRIVFFLAFILCFLAPLLTLLWNGVRKSTWGPALASLFILVGTLLDKVRLYVPSYSIPAEDITAHVLKVVPSTHYPDVFDVMMMVGGISGGVLLFLLAARITPIMSIWEMAEGIRLRAVKPFLKREVVVQGKPE